MSVILAKKSRNYGPPLRRLVPVTPGYQFKRLGSRNSATELACVAKQAK